MVLKYRAPKRDQVAFVSTGSLLTLNEAEARNLQKLRQITRHCSHDLIKNVE